MDTARDGGGLPVARTQPAKLPVIRQIDADFRGLKGRIRSRKYGTGEQDYGKNKQEQGKWWVQVHGSMIVSDLVGALEGRFLLKLP